MGCGAGDASAPNIMNPAGLEALPILTRPALGDLTARDEGDTDKVEVHGDRARHSYPLSIKHLQPIVDTRFAKKQGFATAESAFFGSSLAGSS
jgi:hypothetical protein